MKIYNIWFASKLETSLEDLGKQLGLSEIAYDTENIFEWITGKLNCIELDISRPWNIPEQLSDIEILVETLIVPTDYKDSFTKKYATELASHLKDLDLGPIYLDNKVYFAKGEEKNIIGFDVYSANERRKIR